MTKKYHLQSLADTKLLAQAISKIAAKNFYLLLSGPLASGKTQLTKYIGQELGVKQIINSPSFIILNHYQTKYPWNLIHIDAYRLNKNNDFNEYFELTINNFTIIEWPEQINWNFNNNKNLFVRLKTNKQTRLVELTPKNFTNSEAKKFFDSIKIKVAA